MPSPHQLNDNFTVVRFVNSAIENRERPDEAVKRFVVKASMDRSAMSFANDARFCFVLRSLASNAEQHDRCSTLFQAIIMLCQSSKWIIRAINQQNFPLFPKHSRVHDARCRIIPERNRHHDFFLSLTNFLFPFSDISKSLRSLSRN